MTRIYLAGGCFWGVEAYMMQIKGVINTKVGYMDGNYNNPSYEEVCAHKATHAETVLVDFDESVLSLESLLRHYFHIIDPYTLNKQGNDRGIQYRTGVYGSEDLLAGVRDFIQKEYGENALNVKVDVKSVDDFSLAENYHQRYLEKNPNGYCHINLDDVYKEDTNF